MGDRELLSIKCLQRRRRSSQARRAGHSEPQPPCPQCTGSGVNVSNLKFEDSIKTTAQVQKSRKNVRLSSGDGQSNS